MMKKTGFIGLLVVFFATSSAHLLAADLDKDKMYRLGITLPTLKAVDDNKTNHLALRNSKFAVLGTTSDKLGYIVQFSKIAGEDEKEKHTNLVSREKVYIIPKDVAPSLEVTSIVSETLSGLSAGPLVVPFKYRLNDESLAGDATVGFYAGVTWEPGCRMSSSWCFRLTPLISAGLSQVSIPDGAGSAENKSAVTIAAGFLITGWSDLNIGFVYGQDRTGDQSWAHEGKGWVSLMVGWQLNR